jgi:hypothetical protein
MAKREVEESASMSMDFLQNCKKDILKFGFAPYEYNEFLKSVDAMDENDFVLQYPNSYMEEYRKKFLLKNESKNSFSDMFTLEKFKIKSSREDGTVYETGDFCPVSFWNFIVSEIPFKERMKHPTKEQVKSWLNKYRPEKDDLVKKYTNFNRGVVKDTENEYLRD